jgi:hypothetical protein
LCNPSDEERKEKYILIVRGTLTHPAKGLRPSAHLYTLESNLFVFEGHPHTFGKGAMPLFTPLHLGK